MKNRPLSESHLEAVIKRQIAYASHRPDPAIAAELTNHNSLLLPEHDNNKTGVLDLGTRQTRVRRHLDQVGKLVAKGQLDGLHFGAALAIRQLFEALQWGIFAGSIDPGAAPILKHRKKWPTRTWGGLPNQKLHSRYKQCYRPWIDTLEQGWLASQKRPSGGARYSEVVMPVIIDDWSPTAVEKYYGLARRTVRPVLKDSLQLFVDLAGDL